MEHRYWEHTQFQEVAYYSRALRARDKRMEKERLMAEEQARMDAEKELQRQVCALGGCVGCSAPLRTGCSTLTLTL